MPVTPQAMKRTPLKRTPMKRSKSKSRENVTPAQRRAVLERDGICFIARLRVPHRWSESGVPDYRCLDKYGREHDPRDLGKLTLDHVNDGPMMGKRAPNTQMVAMCADANIRGPSKSIRELEREYLRGFDARA